MEKKIQALFFLGSKDRFTIGECEELAKDLDAHDKMTFELVGPTGRKKAQWLDAYFGFLQIEGVEGFMSSKDFRYVADIHCENLVPNAEPTQ